MLERVGIDEPVAGKLETFEYAFSEEEGDVGLAQSSAFGCCRCRHVWAVGIDGVCHSFLGTWFISGTWFSLQGLYHNQVRLTSESFLWYNFMCAHKIICANDNEIRGDRLKE